MGLEQVERGSEARSRGGSRGVRMGREKVQRTGHHGEVHALNRPKNVNVSIIWPMLKQVPKCLVTFDTLREKMEMSEETSQKK